MTRTRRTTTPDPRVVGGRYISGYWREGYTVTAITTDASGFRTFTCVWEDGRTTTHATAWDARRDSIVTLED